MLAQDEESTTEQVKVVQFGGSVQTQQAPMQDAPLMGTGGASAEPRSALRLYADLALNGIGAAADSDAACAGGEHVGAAGRVVTTCDCERSDAPIFKARVGTVGQAEDVAGVKGAVTKGVDEGVAGAVVTLGTDRLHAAGVVSFDQSDLVEKGDPGRGVDHAVVVGVRIRCDIAAESADEHVSGVITEAVEDLSGSFLDGAGDDEIRCDAEGETAGGKDAEGGPCGEEVAAGSERREAA